MSKKVMGNTHSTKTRERVSAPQGKQLEGRALRRKESRDRSKALASLATHDPRAVKFHF